MASRCSTRSSPARVIWSIAAKHERSAPGATTAVPWRAMPGVPAVSARNVTVSAQRDSGAKHG